MNRLDDKDVTSSAVGMALKLADVILRVWSGAKNYATNSSMSLNKSDLIR